MITLEKFNEIREEVIRLIDNALYQLFKNYSEEYILFMARGEYSEIIAQNKTLNLTPYTICGHREDYYYDETREKFLCNFLNTHYTFLKTNIIENNFDRINIELMIYQHIWEAKLFIKMLYRMANLLCGKDYDWNVKIPIKKTDFFQNQVITSFKNAKCKLGEIIEKCYNTDLRNAIAHSDYQLDEHSKTNRYTSKTALCDISFDDWSEYFAYSFCLSYYLLKKVSERRHRIVFDWGKNAFTIKMPFSNGTIQHVCLTYDVERDDFNFVKK